ncbi:MAG: biopolymer transporter ExbD [Cytophagales bacterium]|nr:MAG: biopolymer transporter ExbD [Cytophagales bacterium]TAF59787.1 MAG: biopolymer transporter ExbD [Cytophagales bacterium]
MAEIDSSSSGKGGKKGPKKVSTKIDMTPMVDLAFLLITFFMLTTTMSKPKTMEVNMPDKTKEKTTMDVKASECLTIILGEGNKVHYYEGVVEASTALETTDFSDEGIRKVILKKAQSLKSLNKVPIIIIKPMDKSNYKNVVDILDEMHITSMKKYAIVELFEQDKQLLKERLNILI